MKKLQLGTTKDVDFTLSPDILQRHLGCFGSSGSGKTVASKVLIEELAINGTPIIAFDPQGDIASLALLEDEETLTDKGIHIQKRREYDENVEIVIWTPGVDKGIPICINPIQFDEMDDLSKQDKVRHFSVTAKNIISLIGYDLGSDDGKTAEAILETLFSFLSSSNLQIENFIQLSKLLSQPPSEVLEVVDGVASKKFLDTLIKKINLLNVGSRKLIFQNGSPANIDTLLGKDNTSTKTRVSIIYLNSLHTQEEKEFFIASIAQSLYRWMLRNPLENNQKGLQCALFLDEAAPYIPPVKKPACKESLELLFRQGRKYGVICIISTQSPGDIDYKAIGQFSSFTLGTLNTKQDILNVKRRLESVAPKEVDFIVKKLPALQPGEFLFVSPDAFDSVQELNVRWLLTKHVVVPEGKIKSILNRDLRKKLLQRGNGEIGSNEMHADIKANKKDLSPNISVDKKSNNLKDPVLYMKNKIFEREIPDRVKPFLSGSIFKSEKLHSANFKYLPLVKVGLIFFEKKGFFRKKIEEIKENLYLSYDTHDLFHQNDDAFQFKSVVDQDPHKIIDLDDIGKIYKIERDDIDFDFRELGRKKINKKKIASLMERKYDVKVDSTDLILFPIWECVLEMKKKKSKRLLFIDGIKGNRIIK